MNIQKQKFQKIFENVTKKKYIHEAVLLVENSDGDVSYSYGYGDKDIDTPFLMASITKLFTTSCIFMLIEQGKLSLEDEVAKFLDKELIQNLHIYKGQDYSDRLTISHLLTHTSGLRDVFEEGNIKSRVQAIHDGGLFQDFHEIIVKTKDIKPHFAPGMGNRAHYVNINFGILGEIIEKVTDSPLKDVFKRFITDPLELENTYLPTDEHDVVPKIYYKDTVIHRPEFMKVGSIGASGGCISTARDLMVFIKAFFEGKLFNEAFFDKLQVSNRLQLPMTPIRYGGGYMRIPMNGLTTFFMGKGELIGHSGSTGSLAFYYPNKDMFFVGDVNQMMSPAIPVRLALQLALSIKS